MKYEAVRVVIHPEFQPVGIAGRYWRCMRWYSRKTHLPIRELHCGIGGQTLPDYAIPSKVGQSLGYAADQRGLADYALAFVVSYPAIRRFVALSDLQLVNRRAAALRIAGGIFLEALPRLRTSFRPMNDSGLKTRTTTRATPCHRGCTGDNARRFRTRPRADAIENYGGTGGRTDHLYLLGVRSSHGSGPIVVWISYENHDEYSPERFPYFVNALSPKRAIR